MLFTKRDPLVEELTPLDVGDVIPLHSVWIDDRGEPVLPLRHRIKRQRTSRLFGIFWRKEERRNRSTR